MASSPPAATARVAAAEGVSTTKGSRGGGGAEPARSLRLPPSNGTRRGVRCSAVGNPGGGGGCGGAAAGEEFVGFFREAWPYIRGHRGSTFVVVISSEVVSGPHFDGILQDISLLHGLGIQFVLVPGTHVQIDKLLTERGRMAKYVGQYRVTDSDSLEAAMEAAGRIRLTIEAKLSPGPPMLNLRRHGTIGRWHGLVDNVASGNFLGAKADKLICIVDGQIFDEHGRAIHFMSLEEADMLIRKRAKQSDIAANYVKVVDEEGISHLHEDGEPSLNGNGSGHLDAYATSFKNGLGFNNGNGIYSGEQGFAIGGEERDVYEGTRIAREEDLLGIRKILRPLEESGVLVKRTDKELLEALESFYVVQRDGSIIACAALFPFPEDKSGEVAAIAVSEECRGKGQGDKLLDYIEKAAMALGLEKLFLLTTRTADWFVRRGFSECSIESIPEQRRKRINLSRGSKYYIKQLQPKHARVTPNNIIAR
uniref:N-acetyltransferase domain-containing protein n=1 Tax=Leersia perrieri TaxID=77586 RepID=A0A0D9X0X3_9ORYZ